MLYTTRWMDGADIGSEATTQRKQRRTSAWPRLFLVQEHGWFTHGFTCGKEKREETKEPMPILLSAVGDTVDPTCCNESLPRIAGHINECMVNLTVEAPLLK